MFKKTTAFILLALCGLSTIPDLQAHRHHGRHRHHRRGRGSGWGWGVGAGLATGALIGAAVSSSDKGGYAMGAPDTKRRDYWRIDNIAPFPITIRTDRDIQTIMPGKSRRGRDMTRVYRWGSFGMLVEGGNMKQELFNHKHNLEIGLDRYGNLNILRAWTQ